MRLCQIAASSRVLKIIFLFPLRLLHYFCTSSAGVDFPWRTKIGKGLMLTHAWGLVVNPNARIGNNVTLFHGVTIGRKDRISVDGGRSSECPDICDDVWIGPHAIIVGGITLGQGCRVAGGAYVTKSVAPYTIVSGNPAVIIKENCLSDVVFRVPL